MNCKKCHLHQDNNDKQYLLWKLDRETKFEKDVLELNQASQFYRDTIRGSIKRLEKMIECKHDFK